jgi:hypothetical protein
MTVLGKLRTRAHVLADLSINHVERQVLLCGFTVERSRHDYGYDLTMHTFRDTGEAEPGFVYVQVKATDQLPLLKDGKTISWPVSRRDLKLWLAEPDPVILIVYDGKKDKAFWLHIQTHFRQRTRELFTAGEMIHVHIPLISRFNQRAILTIARSKNESLRRFLQGAPS